MNQSEATRPSTRSFPSVFLPRLVASATGRVVCPLSFRELRCAIKGSCVSLTPPASPLPAPTHYLVPASTPTLYSSGSSSPKGRERKYDSSNCKRREVKSQFCSRLLSTRISPPPSLPPSRTRCCTHPMQPNVTVLSSTRERLSRGVNGDGVEGTEMTTHSSNLLLQHAVPEPGLELSLTLRSRGDGHGVLSSSENDLRERRQRKGKRELSSDEFRRKAKSKNVRKVGRV
jgi:hypothetical protein